MPFTQEAIYLVGIAGGLLVSLVWFIAYHSLSATAGHWSEHGYWLWGTVLALIVGTLVVTLVLVAPCIDPARAKDAAIISSAPGCRESLSARVYLMVTDLQTGIAATIAVLGVVWTGFFNARS